MAKFVKVSFSTKDLKRIHSAHRGYLIASSHACNQIRFSKIYHILESDKLASRFPESAFIAIRQLHLLRYCIASIFEFNDLTSKYLGSVKTIFPSFAEKHRKAYAGIARKISTESWMRRVRNKLSFHFDSTESAEMLNKISDNQELYFVFGDKNGEIAYSFAEEIASSNLASELGEGELQVGSDKMWDTMNSLSSSISDFHSLLLIDIFEFHGLFNNREAIESDDKSYGVIEKDFIPVFIRSAE